MSLTADQPRSPQTLGALRLVMVQQNFLVGDIPGNAQRIVAVARQADEQCQADIVVFPELALTGYPPEDLLLRPSLDIRVQAAIDEICGAGLAPIVVFGAPVRANGKLYNAALVMENGKIRHRYFKQCPPNYQVFDEKRYFASGSEPLVASLRGVDVGITVCEDLWAEGPVETAAAAGAKLVLNLNASPYSQGKQLRRKALVQRKAKAAGVPIVYVTWWALRTSWCLMGVRWWSMAKATLLPKRRSLNRACSLSTLTVEKPASRLLNHYHRRCLQARRCIKRW